MKGFSYLLSALLSGLVSVGALPLIGPYPYDPPFPGPVFGGFPPPGLAPPGFPPPGLAPPGFPPPGFPLPGLPAPGLPTPGLQPITQPGAPVATATIINKSSDRDDDDKDYNDDEKYSDLDKHDSYTSLQVCLISLHS